MRILLTFVIAMAACDSSSGGGLGSDGGAAPDLRMPKGPGGSDGSTTPMPSDLCQGLMANDTSAHPMSMVAKPAPGELITDPEFGTHIRRITNVTTAGAAIVPMYSTVPAWNADESLLILYEVGGGHHALYDGKSYQFIRNLDIDPPDLEQVFWHGSDPDVLFYVDQSTNTFIRYHVKEDRKESLHAFSNCNGQVSSGDDPVYDAWNSNVFSFLCTESGGGTSVFLYQVDTDQVLAQKPGVPPYDGSAPKPPRMGPSGALTLWNADVTDLSLAKLRTIPILNPDEHTSLGQMANGHDTFNSVIFDPPANQPDNDFVGSLTTYDLTDASHRVIIGPKTGYPYPEDTHLSALTLRNPGWVVVSSGDDTPDGQEVLALELVYADTNTGRVCRVAHHHAWGKNNSHQDIAYWAEAHGVPSPSGTRILFGSDWDNGASVDSYVVELPGYTP